MLFNIKSIQPGDSSVMSMLMLFYALLLLLIIIALVLTFYLAKLTIENISLNNKSIEFNGSFGKYIGTVLLGLFLSMITIGVYSAWFIRDMHRFFIDNSTYDSNALKFQGKGGKLFVIILLTIMVTMIIFGIVMFQFIISNSGQISSNPTILTSIIQQLVTMLIMIPYMYFVYKWMVNVDYKDFNISWETNFWNSCGKIAIEMILSIITIGIYSPLAFLRLYKYFTERTIADSGERKLGFGYDIDQLNDFLFMWGQTLLSIITLGIYYPWAFCKIGNRILAKTYLVEK